MVVAVGEVTVQATAQMQLPLEQVGVGVVGLLVEEPAVQERDLLFRVDTREPVRVDLGQFLVSLLL